MAGLKAELAPGVLPVGRAAGEVGELPAVVAGVLGLSGEVRPRVVGHPVSLPDRSVCFHGGRPRLLRGRRVDGIERTL